jgi:hypothetical protein
MTSFWQSWDRPIRTVASSMAWVAASPRFQKFASSGRRAVPMRTSTIPSPRCR